MTIRHNSMAHRTALDPDTAWQPAGDLFSGARSHDLIRDTVYGASSHGLKRLGQHLSAMQEREAERAE
eukprot:CAMPEP_0168473300 /NCGR_PEP_ID=MMETSP0228-20121227/60254_1 /TAXON_ID=133427 /ORGANISM="Protoceratium reticulatum, Strain CCCM 535 (=CCMP 1889)" /LENGTH=67 /DNA_ID=CAMNT_0008489291 /DNA_START=45 /DNA_END=245 /DNA_ORIENTATION=-